MVADVLHALLRQRMSAHPAFLALARQQLVALQDFEKFQQPAGRLTAAVKKVERGVIGGGFLRDRELQKRALADSRRAEQRCAAAPEDRGAGGGDHRNDAFDARVAHRLLGAQYMATGDMTGLVRDDPDQLVRVLGAQHQPAIDEDRLPASDKGIELIVLDEIDADIIGLQPGGAPDRGGHRFDVVFGLGVAQQHLGSAWRARTTAQCRKTGRDQRHTTQ